MGKHINKLYQKRVKQPDTKHGTDSPEKRGRQTDIPSCRKPVSGIIPPFLAGNPLQQKTADVFCKSCYDHATQKKENQMLLKFRQNNPKGRRRQSVDRTEGSV